MDATLIETRKQEALYCYQGYKACQPLVTYWAEADLVVHSEFRDGNVPARFEQLRVLRESLSHLPEGVGKALLRSDTAGFKRAAAEVEEREWRRLPRMVGELAVETGQEWAEVCYVPDSLAYSKDGPDYRFIAVRELLRRPPLPGMEGELEPPVPAMQMPDRGRYKIRGIVTNRELPGYEVVRWDRERCGKGEEVHGVLKEDLAGGRLPSGQFGANAAWWAMSALAFNLNSAVKQLALGDRWTAKRLKAVRFALINLAGRVVCHARKLLVRLARGHPSLPLLDGAHRRIAALAHGPPGPETVCATTIYRSSDGDAAAGSDASFAGTKWEGPALTSPANAPKALSSVASTTPMGYQTLQSSADPPTGPIKGPE